MEKNGELRVEKYTSRKVEKYTKSLRITKELHFKLKSEALKQGKSLFELTEDILWTSIR